MMMTTESKIANRNLRYYFWHTRKILTGQSIDRTEYYDINHTIPVCYIHRMYDVAVLYALAANVGFINGQCVSKNVY